MTTKEYSKTCTMCKKTKLFSEFNKQKIGKNGLNSRCRACQTAVNAEYRKNNADKVKDGQQKYIKNNPEKVHANKINWANNNPNRIKAIQKKSRKKNVEKSRAKKAKRRAAKLQATPPWFEADKVAFVYKKAVEWGMHVDHVVPLQGKTVCGLHCWANLQLLESSINCSKGNYEWPDQ